MSDATISNSSLFRAKAYICLTIILLLYTLQKYYLNERVTGLWAYRYILQSQNVGCTVKELAVGKWRSMYFKAMFQNTSYNDSQEMCCGVLQQLCAARTYAGVFTRT